MTHGVKQSSLANPSGSAFSGLDHATFGNNSSGGADFGYSNANNDHGSLNFNNGLSGYWMPSMTNAASGMANATQQLEQNPTEQYQSLLQGNNPFYNQMNAQLGRQEQAQMGNIQLQNSQHGLGDSTVLGAAEGQMANDYALANLQAQTQALQVPNQMALQQLSGLGNTANMYQNWETQPAAYAQNAVLASLGGQNQYNQAAMNAQNQVNMANAQMQNQMTGGLISGAMGLAALPISAGLGLGGFGLTNALNNAMAANNGGTAMLGPSAYTPSNTYGLNSAYGPLMNGIGFQF